MHNAPGDHPGGGLGGGSKGGSTRLPPLREGRSSPGVLNQVDKANAAHKAEREAKAKQERPTLREQVRERDRIKGDQKLPGVIIRGDSYSSGSSMTGPSGRRVSVRD